MKTIYSLFLVMIATLICSSCSNQGSPEAVVKKELAAVKAGNYEEAYNCYYFEKQSAKESFKGLYIETQKERAAEKKDQIKSFNIVSVAYDEKTNDKATVVVDIEYTDGSINQNKSKTIKVDGKWYLESGK